MLRNFKIQTLEVFSSSIIIFFLIERDRKKTPLFPFFFFFEIYSSTSNFMNEIILTSVNELREIKVNIMSGYKLRTVVNETCRVCNAFFLLKLKK